MLTLGSTQPGQLRLLPSVWMKWNGKGGGGEGVQSPRLRGEGGRQLQTIAWNLKKNTLNIIFNLLSYV